MESKFSLHEDPTPTRKGRGADSLKNGSPLLDTPRRARRQKARSSPKVEETPERVTAKSMTTRSKRGNPRLAKALNRGSTDVDCSPTLLQTPPLPSSPLEPFLKAGQSPNSASKPRKSSFREKFVYLAGTSSYVDMTSIPTKETARLAIWTIQQLGHFFEHEGNPSGTPATRSKYVQPAHTESLHVDTLDKESSTPKDEEPVTDPTPVTESRREGLRPRKSVKRVRYDDEVNLSDLQGSDEELVELAAEGHLSKTKASSHGKGSETPLSKAIGPKAVSKERWEDRPRTLSQKEIYRRNWAKEHDIIPRMFKLPENAVCIIFPPNDRRISEDESNLGSVLVRVLKSVTEATTLDEEASILEHFVSAIRSSFTNKQALAKAFSKLAGNTLIQESVKSYLNLLGKPEEQEFGESDDIYEQEWILERSNGTRGPGRPRAFDLPAETWKTLSAFKPYSTPYPNLPLDPTIESIAVTEPSAENSKQAELPAGDPVSTISAPSQHVQNVLSETQIDNLLALATNGSASDDEDDDNGALNPLEDLFRDDEMTAILRRHIKEETANQKPTERREDWTLLPFVMTLADPNNTMTPEERFAISEMRFEDFAAKFVHPKVNTVMRTEQARALSEVYKWMAARTSGDLLVSQFANEGYQNGVGAAGASGGAGSRGSKKGGKGRLTKEQLDAIKEDIQKDYDEVRAQKEKESKEKGVKATEE